MSEALATGLEADGRLVGWPSPPVAPRTRPRVAPRTPPRGAVVLGAPSAGELLLSVRVLAEAARAGRAPARCPPLQADLVAAERVAIDYGSPAELAVRAELAARALALEPGPGARDMWRALRPRGVFRGRGGAARVAFLYSGQGSQYPNMLARLRASEPVVRDVFDEADRLMAPMLGRPLTELVFVDGSDPAAHAWSEESMRPIEVTQPAVLAADLALARLLDVYGVGPDMVMGHSLGEYAALVNAGCLTFAEALEVVSGRAGEMRHMEGADPGVMLAVIAPLEEIRGAVAAVGGGAMIANVNSTSQAVVGGPTDAVRRLAQRLRGAGRDAVELPVSHAFHTPIVSPLSGPLRATLERIQVRPPRLPVVANLTGRLYPMEPGRVPAVRELMARQLAAPVQFVGGLRTLHEMGARVFVEVGPKRALQGFADDVLGGYDDVLTLYSNHPKTGELESFNHALCGLFASGLGAGRSRH